MLLLRLDSVGFFKFLFSYVWGLLRVFPPFKSRVNRVVRKVGGVKATNHVIITQKMSHSSLHFQKINANFPNDTYTRLKRLFNPGLCKVDKHQKHIKARPSCQVNSAREECSRRQAEIGHGR